MTTAAPFDLLVASLLVPRGPLFRTHPKDRHELFELFLAALPEPERREHACNTCKAWFRRYGGLVLINPAGETVPAWWPPDEEGVPDFYVVGVRAVARAVRNRRVVGAFLSELEVLGSPEKGGYTHFHGRNVSPARTTLYSVRRREAAVNQAAAITFRRLARYDRATVARALDLAETPNVTGAHTVKGPLRWLHGLHAAREPLEPRQARNLVWLAAAQAPPGFAHSSVTDVVLRGVQQGEDPGVVLGALGAMTRQGAYLRPQVPPATQNVLGAERVVEALGLRPALERRYARLEELRGFFVWEPPPPGPEDGSAFGHLLRPEPGPAVVEGGVATWRAFEETVLPRAAEVRVFLPAVGAYGAVTTAVHPDAPPLLRWDREDARNPFCGYTTVGGAPRSRWFDAEASARVLAVVRNPGRYGDVPPAYLFALEGARDTVNTELCLFPEACREELRDYRATVEAFNKTRTIQGGDLPGQAAGIWWCHGRPVTLLVTTAAGVTQKVTVDGPG
jgi:hypothetical protein